MCLYKEALYDIEIEKSRTVQNDIFKYDKLGVKVMTLDTRGYVLHDYSCITNSGETNRRY